MKHKSATPAVKTLAFMACVLCAIVVAGCVFGVVALSEAGFYDMTQAELIERYVNEADPNYKLVIKLIDIGVDLRYSVYVIGAVALIAAIALFAALMCLSGRRRGSDGVHPGYLNKVPFDVLLAAVGFGGFGLAYMASQLLDARFNDAVSFAVAAAVCVVEFCLALGLCMSFAARIKEGTLLKNTLIAMVLKLLWKVLKAIGRGIRAFVRTLPITWKALLVLAALFVSDIVILSGLSYGDLQGFGTAVLIIKIMLGICVLYAAVMMSRLRKGARALAAGDLSHHLDTSRMVLDLKAHGEDLNSIANGMSIAVGEQLKSERMKTELITNVSHDLKTPLTSIINYAGLINAEPTDNENIKEYCGVLMRQSERLKRLIEDLVEASKASAGVLDVALMPCDPEVFLEQAGGEYEDKLRGAGLELVTKKPARHGRIMADGRRMWRVFDNLMNNACKYAQSGTRVYMSLDYIGKQAVITIKNTSAAPLDISADELMERFVRGDQSRSTEGNGLGLSIAKSMAELQGGTLRLEIDGDLFKAVLSFPEI